MNRFLSTLNKFVNNYVIQNVYYNLKNSREISRFNRLLCTPTVNHTLNNGDIKLLDPISNLDSHKKEQRIYKDDVISVINNIESEGVKNVDNGILLLQCCGYLIPDELPENRLKLVEQIWEVLKKKNVVFTTDHYNTLLRNYIENEMVISHQKFLDEMSCQANEQTYHLLLELSCENGDIVQATEIVNLMKNKGMSANEPVFSCLVFGYLKTGDLKGAQTILETMRIAHLTPTTATFTSLLRGYAELSNVSQFKSTIEASSKLNFTIDQIVLVIRSICISENGDMLNLVKKTWASNIDIRLFETKLSGLCVHLIHINNPELAFKIYKTFIEPESTNELDSYAAFLLYEMIKTQMDPETVIKISNDLIRTGHNKYALFKATHLALSIPDVEFSLALLNALHDNKYILRSHYFWPILIHEGKNNGESGLFRIFQEMQKLNVPIDFDTLETYSLQYINNLDPSVLLERLKQFNITTSEVLTPLYVVMLRANRMKDAANLCKKYNIGLDNHKFIKPLASAFIASNDIESTVVFLKHINEYSKNKSSDWTGQFVFLVISRSGNNVNYQQVKRLLQAYKNNNFTITSMYYERIENMCNKIKDTNLKTEIEGYLEVALNHFSNAEQNNVIPHPRNMNLEELECHLVELTNKKMETRGIFRKLIQMHCRLGNINRVDELLKDFHQLKYNMSAGIRASLLDLYVKYEKYNDAWKMYNEIKKTTPSFLIDEFKIIDLARVLVKNDLFEDALKIIDLESANRRIRGDKSSEHNCWSLLNEVARFGNATHTQLMFDTLLSKNYCSESNVLLGPLVRVCLNNDNLNAAVDKFVKCSSQYNKTPLLHELLCKLMTNEAPAELIQKVVDASVKVHGSSSTQMSLVAALAESGKVQNLRKLFVDSKIHLSQHLFEQHCEKWIKDNNVTVFQNILYGAKGLKMINLTIVYTSLMRLYSVNNDCNGAINLWTEILEAYNAPPKQIKDMLDNLLKNQNHPKINNIQT